MNVFKTASLRLSPPSYSHPHTLSLSISLSLLELNNNNSPKPYQSDTIDPGTKIRYTLRATVLQVCLNSNLYIDINFIIISHVYIDKVNTISS